MWVGNVHDESGINKEAIQDFRSLSKYFRQLGKAPSDLRHHGKNIKRIMPVMD